MAWVWPRKWWWGGNTGLRKFFRVTALFHILIVMVLTWIGQYSSIYTIKMNEFFKIIPQSHFLRKTFPDHRIIRPHYLLPQSQMLFLHHIHNCHLKCLCNYLINLIYHTICFWFFPFGATPASHESSQVRGPIPRLGVELELPLQAYTTAMATPDPSFICDLHCSLRQHQILNPLSHKVRPGIKPASSWVLVG